jgi:hypothetical protein
MYVEMRNTHKVFMGKPRGKRLLGRPTCSQEDNIKMALKERGWEGVDLINLAHYRDK